MNRQAKKETSPVVLKRFHDSSNTWMSNGRIHGAVEIHREGRYEEGLQNFSDVSSDTVEITHNSASEIFLDSQR